MTLGPGLRLLQHLLQQVLQRVVRQQHLLLLLLLLGWHLEGDRPPP
jgi:hypothetical protein